jgi:hypothetical protein
MSKRIQSFIRSTYHYLPLHCHLCGHLILSKDDADFSSEYSEKLPSPCKHTLYISHSEGHEYLSDRVKTQLIYKHYIFEQDDFFTITNSENEELFPYELSEILEFEDGLNIESVVGAPSNMTVYVGIAPVEGEY